MDSSTSADKPRRSVTRFDAETSTALPLWDTAGVLLAGDVDWGNVPAWVSGILSALSVLLVVYVILRDRRKAERSQAEGVITWTRRTVQSPDKKATVILFLLNTSDRPIRIPNFRAIGRKSDRILKSLKGKPTSKVSEVRRLLTPNLGIPTLADFYLPDDKPPEIAAQEEVQLTLSLEYPAFFYNFFLTFTDARGKSWLMDFQRSRLFSAEAWQRWAHFRAWWSARRPDVRNSNLDL